jgi:hypothetical protein
MARSMNLPTNLPTNALTNALTNAPTNAPMNEPTNNRRFSRLPGGRRKQVHREKKSIVKDKLYT